MSKPVNVVEKKVENNKKGPAECDMGYDIIEDIKKTKANVSLFEISNLPQHRKKILEPFDQQTSRSHDYIQSKKDINESIIGGKS